jgi:hypothetical protein
VVDEHGSLLLAELREGLLHECGRLLHLRSPFGIVAFVGGVLRHFVSRFFLPAALSAQVHQPHVDAHAMEECRDPRVAPVRLEGPHELDVGLLNEVFQVGAVADDPVQNAPGLFPSALVKLCKGDTFPVSRSEGERTERICHRGEVVRHVPVGKCEGRHGTRWLPGATPLIQTVFLMRSHARMRIGVLALVMSAAAGAETQAFDAAAAARFTKLALACVHREYPNKLAHVLNDAKDVRAPRQLTPAFYGCYDWHSSVHGHWLLARLARTFPEAPFAAEARRVLAVSLTAKNLAAELKYFEGKGRVSFERPYGLAWLLQLAAELREWKTPEAQQWSKSLEPLERATAARLTAWLPKLSRPIRVGEHDQTAFAFGLILDWARSSGDAAMVKLLQERVEVFYGKDRECPLSYEPGGQDFLSPCLAEADLMRRVMNSEKYATWLRAFLPGIPQNADEPWLVPEVVTDRSDPKLAHLDGLNLSRAWMLDGVVASLPASDPRVAALSAAALAHRVAGLESVTGEHYEGGHWLGSFAVYLVTRRGL